MNHCSGCLSSSAIFLCGIDSFGFEGVEDLAAVLFLQPQPVGASL